MCVCTRAKIDISGDEKKWMEGGIKQNPSPDVQYRLANPAKLVCSTNTKAVDVLFNVIFAGKITIKINFFDPEIALRCAQDNLGVKKVLKIGRCPCFFSVIVFGSNPLSQAVYNVHAAQREERPRERQGRDALIAKTSSWWTGAK